MERFALTRVQASRPRGFRLLDAEGVEFGSARATGLFSFDMRGALEGEELHFKASGGWGRHYLMFLNGVQVGEIRPAGWGEMRLTLWSQGGQQVLQLVRGGLFSSRCYLRVDKDMPLFEIQPSFNWRAFSNDFMLRAVGRGMTPAQMVLLIAMTGFAMRWRAARAASAGT